MRKKHCISQSLMKLVPPSLSLSESESRKLELELVSVNARTSAMERLSC
jgi:hypothetical protein